jgi:hypothetical protein
MSCQHVCDELPTRRVSLLVARVGDPLLVRAVGVAVCGERGGSAFTADTETSHLVDGTPLGMRVDGSAQAWVLQAVAVV